MKGSDYDIHIKSVRVDLPDGKKLFSIPKWQVPFGSHVLLRGESGLGKTTLLHLIAGLFKPSEGEVLIGSTNLNELSDNALCDLRRSSIGVIFQKLNLIDHLTLKENVLLAAPKSKNADKPALQALERVQLKKKSDQRSSTLSLGEQQRVAVARVLATPTPIILADEPTSSLDEKNTHFVMQALKEAAHEKTLIVVSHDDRLAKYFPKTTLFSEVIR